MPAATTRKVRTPAPVASAISMRAPAGNASPPCPARGPSAERSSIGNFAGGGGLNSQSVYGAGHFLGQNLIHHPVPLDARAAGKRAGDDGDGEMGLAGNGFPAPAEVM